MELFHSVHYEPPVRETVVNVEEPEKIVLRKNNRIPRQILSKEENVQTIGKQLKSI